MKKIIILLLIIFLSGCLPAPKQYQHLVMPQGEILKVKLAITASEKSKGLSLIEEMENYEGMLFVFSQPIQAKFWMKEMKFPLDIVYLNNEMQVLEIHENLAPCSEQCPHIVSATDNVRYVLEMEAGRTSELNLQVNQKIEL